MRHGRIDRGDLLPDPEGMTDREILDALVNFGIEITIDEFKAEALKAGSPEVLAGNWSYTYGIEEVGEEIFLYGAIRELWKRHLGYEKRPPEILSEFIDDVINTYEESPEEHSRYTLLNTYERIKEFYLQLLKEDGTPNIDLYHEISWYAHHDFEAFLFKIPYELARDGLVDEAVNIGRWFAELSSQSENFLRDTGVILAEAGRRDEAIRQIEENLRRFRGDIWVTINAGDAMQSLGEIKSAEGFFFKAKRMATTKDDKMSVLERLIDLYEGAGMLEKAKECEIELTELTDR